MAYDSALPDGAPDGATPQDRSALIRRFDDALTVAPSRYRAGHQAAMHEIEDALDAVVDDLRGRGLEPERVLVFVKAHVAARAAHPDDLLEDVVRRCIVRYFQRQDARGGS
jgi:hypothetical protein